MCVCVFFFIYELVLVAQTVLSHSYDPGHPNMTERNGFFPHFVFLVVVSCFIFPTLLYKSIIRQDHADSNITFVRNKTFNRARREPWANGGVERGHEPSMNCVQSAIDEFPRDLMTQHQRLNQGGVIVHFLVSIYMFGALAIVCEEYLVPSLDKVIVNFNIQSDVVGATFMAAGTSAPEMFISAVGLFVAKGDVGLGTVVGSAVFNNFFIVAMCCFFAASVRLSLWPLLRDSICSFLSIMGLVLVTFDNKVYWYQALALVIFYCLYVALTYFNSTLEAWFNSIVTKKRNEAESVEEGKPLLNGRNSGDVKPSSSVNNEVAIVDRNGQTDLFSMPPGLISGVNWILGLPISCLFFVTIPDCRKESWKRWYLVSFAVSVVWIGALSGILVWMVTIIGYTLQIPDVVIGMTFLAAGSSVPDALSSVIVARKGDGDMAISHAIATNVFNILICLGLPWLLKTIADPGDYVEIESGSVIFTSVGLLATVLVLFLLIAGNKWYLNKYLGGTLIVLYLAFIAVASLFELNMFGEFNLPPCPI